MANGLGPLSVTDLIRAAQEQESRRQMTHTPPPPLPPSVPMAGQQFLTGLVADLPEFVLNIPRMISQQQAELGFIPAPLPPGPWGETPVQDVMRAHGVLTPQGEPPAGDDQLARQQQALAFFSRGLGGLVGAPIETALARGGAAVAREAGGLAAEAGAGRVPWQAQRGAIGPLGESDFRSGLLKQQLAEGDIRRAAQAPLEQITPEVRAVRAQEQGYIGPLYHGTKHLPREQTTGIEAFNPRRFGKKTDAGWYGKGVYMSADPELSAEYAGHYVPVGGEISAKPGATVYPLMARLKNPFVYNRVPPVISSKGIDVQSLANAQEMLTKLASLKGWSEQERELFNWQYKAQPKGFVRAPELDDIVNKIGPARFSKVLKANGHDGVIINTADQPMHEVLAFNPSQIRSVHAQFDPKKLSSWDILAGLAAAGVGLPTALRAGKRGGERASEKSD
jgi:ADP-Ribosyltransferase in polyvalent proteins